MDSAAAPPLLLADCHLHFEGCLPVGRDRAPGRARRDIALAIPPAFERGARASVGDAAGFLALFAEVCRLFRRPEDYVGAALAVAGALADDGVDYAEVYVSPEIFTRIGLDAGACLEAIDVGFREALETRGILCRILLDAVRHWGPESADRVLDLYERQPLPSIVGFGMGGDEASLPAAAFGGVYLRARVARPADLGPRGEWAGADSVRDVLDALRPDRIDHGIAAAADPRLLERLAEEGTILCVAPTGNLRTRAVASAAGPIRCAASSTPACASRSRPTTRCSSARRPAASTGSRARRSASTDAGAARARVQRLARGLLHATAEGGRLRAFSDPEPRRGSLTGVRAAGASLRPSSAAPSSAAHAGPAHLEREDGLRVEPLRRPGAPREDRAGGARRPTLS